MGPAFEDIRTIRAIDERQVQIDLKERSQFVVEALETAIQKPGNAEIGTGPYRATGKPSELQANSEYYLGRPNIDRIELVPYPNVRAAWAELLRGNIDMLYETNIDALDSLESSTNVTVFSYVRHYQYMILFGASAPELRSAEVRRELNAAIDRSTLIRDALSGHGVPSAGPIPPLHWALEKTAPRFQFDRHLASRLASRHLHFKCLVPADSVYERVALVVKQQLAAASVDMEVEEVPPDVIVQRMTRNDFQTLLLDVISGPSVFRSFRHWHSGTNFNPKPIVSAEIDETLDRIRHARTDDDYRAGVTAFLQAIADNPPALFLAWGERARAVSRKFDVVTEEKGRDILINLRLWRPAGMQQAVTQH